MGAWIGTSGWSYDYWHPELYPPGLPDGFRLSVKAPRGLTHARKLYEPEPWLERIAASWHELDGRRAVLLLQLAPAQARDDTRLDYFFAQVPD